MPRKSFNWSALDRNCLYALLHRAGPLIVGRKVPVKELQSILAATIKDKLPVSVVKRNDPTHTKNCVYIGGFYYSDKDIMGQRQIQIVFSYNPSDEFIKISQTRWSRICRLFADTVLHEMIHMRQYRARNFKSLPGYASTAQFKKTRLEQEYYGHRDEMGAYSFNIACELFEKFGTDLEKAVEFLDKSPCPKKPKNSFHRYLEAFDWNHSHPMIRRLKRLVLKKFPNCQSGKPFKTDNHLTY